ncbi:hypothetical protein J6590_005386 [Homalodisca vitripennis]|nr:hypothetical protein J6590_005386 [Homalodisca vitripennis]
MAILMVLSLGMSSEARLEPNVSLALSQGHRGQEGRKHELIEDNLRMPVKALSKSSLTQLFPVIAFRPISRFSERSPQLLLISDRKPRNPAREALERRLT